MRRIELNGLNYKLPTKGVGLLGKDDITTNLKVLKGYPFTYILGLDDEITYIGYSSDIYHRLTQHKSSRNFDVVILMEFHDKATARQIEKRLILEYAPKGNNQFL